MAQQTAVRAGSGRRDPWRYRWIVLGVATFTQAASGFFVGGIGALGIQLQSALELSTAQLGLLVSAAQLAPLVGLLVAGVLLDRYGERWVVGIGAGVVGLALGVGSLASGYPALLGALLVVGAGYSTVQPGGSKSVASWFDASQRGFAMGVRQAGLPLGAALASAVLPVVAREFGWRATLVTGCVVALAGAGLFMGCYRRPPASAVAVQPSVPLSAQLRARLGMLREPAMVKIMLAGTSLVSVQCGVGVLTVLHLHREASIGAGQAALVLVAAQGAGVVGRVCLAAWSDRSRFGRHAVVLVCMAAVAVGLALLMTPVGGDAVVASGVFVWLGFFGFGWYGPWVAHLTETAPPGRTGFALGLAMSVNQVAIITVPPVLGLLVDLAGSFTPAWALLALLTVVALAVTTGAELRDRRRELGRRTRASRAG